MGTSGRFSITATQNTAKEVKKWLADKTMKVKLWSSPSLTENLWRELKIRESKETLQPEGLELITEDEWTKIPAETCRKFLVAVISNKDFSIYN